MIFSSTTSYGMIHYSRIRRVHITKYVGLLALYGCLNHLVSRESTIQMVSMVVGSFLLRGCHGMLRLTVSYSKYLCTRPSCCTKDSGAPVRYRRWWCAEARRLIWYQNFSLCNQRMGEWMNQVWNLKRGEKKSANRGGGYGDLIMKRGCVCVCVGGRRRL